VRLAVPDLHKRTTWAWIAAGVALIVAVIIGLAEAPSSSDEAAVTSTYSQHPEDVAVTSCTVRDGRLASQVKITNNSPDDATYAVKVNFASPDGKQQYSTGMAIVSELRPQKSETVDVAVSKKVGDVPVSCEVLEAARYGT
jgi:hypothetical protein